MAYCYFCGSVLPETLEIGRSTACPSCGKDVKICLNCTFYAPGAHWDCRETISEPVREKERANFCDFFSPSTKPRKPQANGSATKAKKQFNSLFGNG